MPNSKNINLILEYDDFCDQEPENCLNFIDEIIEENKKIIFNMFTVPCMKNKKIQDLFWIEKVKNHIKNNNLNIGIHGLFHNQEEFKYLTKNQAKEKLLISMDILTTLDIKFEKIFRGPHWGINADVYEALIDLNFSHVYSHENYKTLNDIFSKDIKIVYYNWNLKDDFVFNEKTIVAHGHTHDVCDNGIKETFHKIKNLEKINKVFYKKISDI